MKTSDDYTLVFSGWAWAKLNCWRDLAPRLEVGCWGYTPDTPLSISDLVLVKQEVSSVRVLFDMLALGQTMELFAKKYDIPPEEWLRIWIHTHPFKSATPSNVDEETWNDLFDTKSSGIMVIVSEEDEVYARLILRADDMAIQTEIDAGIPLPREWGKYMTPENLAQWESEYKELVTSSSFTTESLSRRTPFDWEKTTNKVHDAVRQVGTFDWDELPEEQWTAYLERHKLNRSDGGEFPLLVTTTETPFKGQPFRKRRMGFVQGNTPIETSTKDTPATDAAATASDPLLDKIQAETEQYREYLRTFPSA